MFCTSPLKAYQLSRKLMYEKITKNKIFINPSKKNSNFAYNVAEYTTNYYYNQPGELTPHKIPRILFNGNKRPVEWYNCYTQIELPCGHCEACKLNRANDWAVRCFVESTCHKQNCFITLTYNPENLPKNRTLVKKDLQDFWKRLRKNSGVKLRYVACGEYGPKTLRPHYHASIFGYCPNDLKFYKNNHKGQALYNSEFLSKCWGKGFVVIGELNFETCGYVARYCTKKLSKNFTAKHGRLQEFIVASNRPGIGFEYLQMHKNEIWNNNGIWQKTQKGVFLKPIPKYFLKKFKLEKDTEEIQNEYQIRNNIIQKEMADNWENILSKTTLNKENYLKMTQENNKEKLKILSRNNIDTNFYT